VKKPTPKASPLEILNELRKAHPDAHCELVHENAYQLLVATVLSAQTTDVAVNKATPALFAAYPTPETLAKASAEDVEQKLSTIGMFRQKTKNVMKLASMLVEKHRGEVPRSLDALVELPGVGRKTANVVLGVIWGTPEGVVVDTHVQRLSQRLGFTKETEPEKIERALCTVLPRETWDITSHTLIFHGRRVCFARKPACDTCTVNTLCPSAFEAEEVGRKPKRERVPPKAEAMDMASKKPAGKAQTKTASKRPSPKAPSKTALKKPAPKKPAPKKSTGESR
jgi:endonuclease-3